MRLRFYLNLFFAGFLLGSTAFADVTISVAAVAATGKFQLPGGGDLPEGSVYAYGLVDTGGVTGLNTVTPGALEFSELMEVFTIYGSFTFNASGEVGVLGAPLSGGDEQDQLSALVYLADQSAAGIFSSSSALWDYPADPGGATLSNSLIDVAYLGSLGNLSLMPLSVPPAPIPEPTTAAFWILGAVGFWKALRRRRCSPPSAHERTFHA